MALDIWMAVSWAIEICNEHRGEDRASQFSVGERIVFVLADGAGGVGSGGAAAEVVVQEAEALANGLHSLAREALSIADSRISGFGGMSTGVIVEVAGGVVSGASCGDSVAWLLAEGVVTELTANQLRKPLLGNGAEPVSFGPAAFSGRLLLASDGLVNYVTRSEIISAARLGGVPSAAKTLVSRARLKSGKFSDDIAVILADADV
jgi:PPM family protein phosphatase